MSSFDDRLSAVLRADGLDDPAAPPDTDGAMSDFRRRRSRRLAMVGTATCVVVLAVGAGIVATTGGGSNDVIVPATAPEVVLPSPDATDETSDATGPTVAPTSAPAPIDPNETIEAPGPTVGTSADGPPLDAGGTEEDRPSVPTTIEGPQAPIATTDVVSVEAGATVEIEVLANDLDPDGDHGSLSVVAISTAPGSGLAELSGDRVIRYFAPPVETSVAIGYRVQDPDGLLADGLVCVVVTSSEDGPVDPTSGAGVPDCSIDEGGPVPGAGAGLDLDRPAVVLLDTSATTPIDDRSGTVLAPMEPFTWPGGRRLDSIVVADQDRGGWTIVDRVTGDRRSQSPCSGAPGCSARLAALVGDTSWFVVDEGPPEQPERSTLRSATGDRESVHVEAPAGTRIVDGRPTVAGLVYAVERSSEFGAGELDVFLVVGERTIPLYDGAKSIEVSADGRWLATSDDNPPESYGRTVVEVVDLATGTVNGFELSTVADVPVGWSPDGRRLVMAGAWEETYEYVVDPWSDADPTPPFQESEAVLVGDRVCFVDREQIAVARWHLGYGDAGVTTGTVEIVRSSEPDAPPGDLGVDLYASEMVCHPDGSVTLAERVLVGTELAEDLSIVELDPGAATRVVTIERTGAQDVVSEGDVSLVRLP